MAGDVHAPTEIIRFEGVYKRYGPGGAVALREVNVCLHAGATGLLGPNGAGKTTFVHACLGLVPIEEGRVEVLGVDVSRDPLAVRRRVGFMPEVDATIPGLSGTELVAYAAELSGIPRGASLQRAHEALAWAGLKEERYRPVGGYSTGMRQRLRLAQAIVHDPELVFLDEPTDGLDPRGREAMLSLIESLPGEHGIHVVLSSHLLKDVERVCKEAVLLRAGRVIGAGRVADMTGGQQGLYDVVLRGERRRFAAELAERGGLLIEAGPGRDRVRLSGPSTTRPIVEAAAASGVQLRRLVPSRLSLEDAFLAAMSPETSERGAAHADS